MKHYIEVTLVESDDFSPYELWSRLIAQMHLALVEVKDHDNQVNIGASFPQYRFNSERGIGFLGSKLRIFAETEAELKNLKLQKWLDRLTDYVHITSIREVPQDKITGYVCFQRKQIKTNAERLARHRVKRGDIDFDEALKRYQNVVTTTDLPYIQMKSLTSDKSFKLFIEKKNSEKNSVQKFSTYGLSASACVPEF
ncbi:CRISPR-associated endonuclease Csy4 [Acinetobacter calcoaceticus]|uniref:CRISPR-associated endonuclease Csy4 n=1 Tax=Acinetobacter calcoaceticus TaxID=471 RepID=A0A4R1XWG9_ACICA|nr:CRISPR-associated endonuclease Csy4 [Acinetobacter calcoaceticus]